MLNRWPGTLGILRLAKTMVSHNSSFANRRQTMDFFWKRPDNVPYPKVWLEFTAKESKNSDRMVKYWIQDIPENRFDDAIQHLAEHFLVGAPISTYFGNDKNICEKKLSGKLKEIQFEHRWFSK